MRHPFPRHSVPPPACDTMAQWGGGGNARRQWLSLCAFPGEAQVVERLTLAFAERFTEENRHAFSSVEQAYFLATQLFMVNTMLHNPNAGHTAAITADAFSRILRTEPDGADLDDAYLRAKFNSIKARAVAPAPSRRQSLRHPTVALTPPPPTPGDTL